MGPFPAPPPPRGVGPRSRVPEASESALLADGKGGSASIAIAHGNGTLRDARTGFRLYEGEWLWGCRHGQGRGWIFTYVAGALGSGVPGADGTMAPPQGGPASAMGAAAAVSGMSGTAVPTGERTASADDWALSGVYDGAWVGGKRHGRGSIVYSSGDDFEGEWVSDARHGAGRMRLAGGGTVSGFWVRDRLHGSAVFRWPFGGFECRVFHHGVQLCARSITEAQARRGMQSFGALTAAAGDVMRIGDGQTAAFNSGGYAAAAPSPSRLEAQHKAAQLALAGIDQGTSVVSDVSPDSARAPPPMGTAVVAAPVDLSPARGGRGPGRGPGPGPGTGPGSGSMSRWRLSAGLSTLAADTDGS